ncbi:MAG: hypothetical protein P8Z30_05810 [Acidobacteriota bacterium]
MARTNDKRIVEYEPIFEDTGIHLSDEEWDSNESNDMPVHHKRRAAGLWTALASLAVALAIVAGYGYSVISKQNSELARLSGRLDSFSAIPGRTSKLEVGLEEWETRQTSLAAHVQSLDAGLKPGLDKVRLHAAALVANADQREQEALGQHTAILNAQISEMTSHQHAQQIHIAQLERELASTRQELSSAREGYEHELAALQQQRIATQQEIVSLDNRFSMDQVAFSVEKNKDEEIVPGVILHLTRTNAAHQRFRGWIRLLTSNRRIWVRDNSIERPVIFHPGPGGKAYELIVTRVNSGGAAGYLLVPGNSKGQQTDVASGSKPPTATGAGSL